MTLIASTISDLRETERAASVCGCYALMRRHAFIIPSFLIAMLVCFWFVTWGNFRLFDAERFTSFYDAQARALLHGRFDVPPDAIGFEAFVREGKSYGYFGIAPSLIRLPLVILFPKMDGRWSRMFMLLACGINLLCAYRLVLRFRGRGISTVVGPSLNVGRALPAAIAHRRAVPALHRGWDADTSGGSAPPTEAIDSGRDAASTRIGAAQKILLSLFVLCAGIGSTNIFIASRSYTYHEAIMWGGTFALLFTDCLLSYLATPKLRLLAMAGLFAFLSFHSRPTTGTGALLALCVLITVLAFRPKRGSIIGMAPVVRPVPHVLLACFAVLMTVGVYFGVNYGRFRAFDGVPVRFYAQYLAHPERMAATGGRQFHLENAPTALASYFGFGGLRFSSQFPWAFMVQRPIVLGSPNIDVVEPYSSAPLSMPAIVFLALGGAWPIVTGRSIVLRRFRLPVIALLLGGSIVLFTVGMTQRYLHDFYPFLIVAGAAGVCRLAASPLHWRMAGLLTVLAAISIYLNCTFALEFKRNRLGISESHLQELVRMRSNR